MDEVPIEPTVTEDTKSVPIGKDDTVEPKISQKDDTNKDSKDDSVSEEDEKSGKEEKGKGPPARFFNEDDKSIRCRNWGECGHYARSCPNEIKIENCRLCGQKSHDMGKDSCSFILCFSCNKGGHTISQWNLKSLITWGKCRMNGKILKIRFFTQKWIRFLKYFKIFISVNNQILNYCYILILKLTYYRTQGE